VVERAPVSRRAVLEVRARPRAFEDPSQVVGVRPYQSGAGGGNVRGKADGLRGALGRGRAAG